MCHLEWGVLLKLIQNIIFAAGKLLYSENNRLINVL